MGKVYIHRGAREDHQQLRERDEETAAEIWALVQEACSNPKLLDLFTAHDYGAHGTERFHVSQWFEQQRQGRNLWRLKIWDLEKAGIQERIVYAFNPLNQSTYILGIVARDFNYDEKHPITQRILAAYDKLDIPQFKGSR